MSNLEYLFEQWTEQLGGTEPARHKIAMMLFEKQQMTEAIQWLKIAADRHYAPSQYELGNAYYAGIGVAENIEKAFYYYKLAALQGHADAANNLADMYLNGEATEVDEEQALKWFHLAADQGVVEAMFTLGLMYEQGLGTEVDEEKAFQCYEASANGQYEDAQYRMGMIFLEGLLNQNPDEACAINWFEQAAHQFQVDAIFNLGYLYEQAGQRDKALLYYKQAAMLGDYQAKCQLADIYRQGILVEKNEQEAMKWQQAAEKQLALVQMDE